jgi:hypothetical protein
VSNARLVSAGGFAIRRTTGPAPRRILAQGKRSAGHYAVRTWNSLRRRQHRRGRQFQGTGYLVERIYKASYGDASGASTLGGAHSLPVPIVRLNEFLPDTQEIGLGVVVGQGNWQQQLENNKQAFTSEFVQRSRFTTAFATSMTPAEFVDKLFQNGGVMPTASDRTAAINEFGPATTSADVAARSRALRDVAENSTLNQQEFNRAFVLMQFLGYLRRNPNDAPDADYTGYDFWLTKLNQFNGNYGNAEMVKAFIVSGEYRGRFGP